MKSGFVKFVVGIVLLFSSSLFANENKEFCPTYFKYNTEDIKRLSALHSNLTMSKEELIHWDQVVSERITNNESIGPDAYRLYAYLYTAQKDAGFLSYDAHQKYAGSLDRISSEVIRLFFPSQEIVSSDEYSNTLSDIVMAKIRQRFDEENAQIKDSPLQAGDPSLSAFEKPDYGLKIASWRPWLLKDPKEFMATKPMKQDDSFWKEEAAITKKSLENATEEQKKAYNFWAGDMGPGSGDWLVIATQYMLTHKVSFQKMLFVRAVLAEAGVDYNISCFYSKYTYLMKRPMQVDPSIVTAIKTPHHPTYPSGHSTLSSMTAILLGNYFPEEKAYWLSLAKQAGQSRIWAGIHFPIDDRSGWVLGTRLAEAIEKLPQAQFNCSE